MTKWYLRCRTCKNTWALKVSYSLKDMTKLYHYCPYCKKNTFHDILYYEDDVRIRSPESGRLG